ncbi:oxidative stress defense protein [mine drainage metagenome]|uniref:Oxidative stress defense protein n=1 Tax=mine drainage metagenome TaxID=410659 RepID=A0A1J5Q5R0_9ZZZZ
MSKLSKGIRISTATVISSLLIAVAMGAGLFQVGRGLALRADATGLTITGSAHVNVSADRAVWTLTVTEMAPTANAVVTRVSQGVDALSNYFKQGGIDASLIELGGVSTSYNLEYINGNSTGKILSYQASRDVTVRSNDVKKIQQLSQNLGVVLATGVNVFSNGPQYYVSTLSDLRPQLLANAMKDAKVRAIALTKATGTSVGAVRSARQGPVQVTAADSVEVSDGGVYDTRTIDKTVTTTVTVVFAQG